MQTVAPRAPTGRSVRSRTEGSDSIFVSTILVTAEGSTSRLQRTAPEVGALRVSGNSGQLRMGVQRVVVYTSPGIEGTQTPNCNVYLRAWPQQIDTWTKRSEMINCATRQIPRPLVDKNSPHHPAQQMSRAESFRPGSSPAQEQPRTEDRLISRLLRNLSASQLA